MNTYDPVTFVPVALLVIAALIAGYFIPTVVAVVRRHRNIAPIALINVFFGWSVLGWFVALIWSFTADVYPASKA